MLLPTIVVTRNGFRLNVLYHKRA